MHERTRGNGCKLEEGRFSLDTRNIWGLSVLQVLYVKAQWHVRTIYTSERWIWDAKSLRPFTQWPAWLWQSADTKFHSWWFLCTSSASLYPASRGWVLAFTLRFLQSLWLALIAKRMLITQWFPGPVSPVNWTVREMCFKIYLFLITAVLSCVTFSLMFALSREEMWI